MREPSGRARLLLWFSFVIWAAMMVARFWQTGEARTERTPAANPILAGLSDKLLLLSSYMETLQKDPQYSMIASMHLVDQLHSAAEDQLSEAQKEAPLDVGAQCRAIVLQGILKHPAQAAEMLAEVRRDTAKQPQVQPLLDILSGLYGTEQDRARFGPTDDNSADIAVGVVQTSLSGWFRSEALRTVYDLRHREAESTMVAEDEAKSGERAFKALVLGGAVIAFNFIAGCILLFLLPFFHRVANLRDERDTPRWWWGTGWMVYVWFMVAELAVGVAFLWLNRGHADNPSIPAVVGVQFIVYAVSFIGVLYLVRSPEAGWNQLGLHSRHLVKCVFLGIGSYMCALPCVVVAGIVTTVLMKHAPTSQNGVFSLFNHAPTGFSLLALMALVCVVGPLVEEVVFRGVLYGSLRQVLKPWQAVIASAAIFALVHADLPALLPIFVLAVFMATVFEKTGSLVPSFVMHMMQNTTTFLFTLFLVS